MSKVDVIIPLYNEECHISKCVDSILNQSYKDYTVILVDDGSVDQSGSICDAYAAAYENVIVYHKKNEGLAASRNYGVAKATADYIAFVDADDFVEEHYLEFLLGALQEKNADIAICGSQEVYDKEAVPAAIQHVTTELIDRCEAYRRMFMQEGIDVSACEKIYKREMLVKVTYPNGELYEDFKAICQVMEQCESIAVVDYKGYYYYQHETSIMHSGMSLQTLSLIATMEQMREFFSEKYPMIMEAWEVRYVRICFHVLNRAIYAKGYEENAKQLKREIVERRGFIWRSGKFRKHEKLATCLLILSMPLYKWGLNEFRKGKA